MKPTPVKLLMSHFTAQMSMAAGRRKQSLEHGMVPYRLQALASTTHLAPMASGPLLKATGVNWTELLALCLSVPEVASRAVSRCPTHSASFGQASPVSLKLTEVELMPFPEAMPLRLDHNQPTSGKVGNTSVP